ncbi:MFS transporter [Streptomyces sp. NBC_01275]|uniref:MFS transporter n=1 Tax=Streptomyces sp. NBC_01275 TaxID=2903807 RepID=UPI002250CE72|nr:MFS transporter [Streptomyces sp. NBC_01275]MCX4759455.1 MFS transporter [Streptomyces sp. NBC_01275]
MAISLHSDRPPAGRHAAVPPGTLFRRIYAPRAFDALAFSMTTYAMPLLVLATTGSARLTGLAFALEWIPRVAAFGVAGDLVDRRGAAIVFFLASLGRGVLVGAAGVALVLLGPGTGETVTVLVVAAATGTLTQFSFVANEALGGIVSRRQDTKAHRVQSVLIAIDQTATLVGPALGGLLLLIGPSRMLAALSVLSLLAAVLALQTPPTPLRSTRCGGKRAETGMATGWRTLLSLPALGRLVAGLAVSNLALALLQSTSPIVVVERFGLSTAAVGTLWSVAAASTLLTVAACRFALDRLGLWGVGVVCSCVASAACLALTQAPSYFSYVVLMALFMAGDGGLTIVLRTVRSHVIPPAVFGATMSLTILILLLPFPVAGIVVALTPPSYLAHAVAVCGVLQALALGLAFLSLRNDPALGVSGKPKAIEA